jgi:SAM-dependent methyltransferase
MTHAAAARAMRVMPAALLVVALLAGARTGSAAPAPDVPYVPTPDNVVEAMLRLARVGPADYLIDLGCGDGRIVITAAKRFGTRGFGVDLDSALVADARRAAERAGVADRVEFHARNLFNTDISRATVVTMYLLQSVNLRLRPRLLKELAPGTRIVSHDFDLEGWQPDARVTVPVPDKPYGPLSSEVFLWVVPADASGDWRWRATVAGAPREYTVSLDQAFQMVHGTVSVGGRAAGSGRGRLDADQIRFSVVADIDGRAVRHEFSGRVTGDGIAGWVTLGGDASNRIEWRATRTARGRMNIDAGAAAPASQRISIAEEQI